MSHSSVAARCSSSASLAHATKSGTDEKPSAASATARADSVSTAREDDSLLNDDSHE